MTAIKGLLSWVRRKAIIFILLVLALVAHQLLLPTWRSHSDLGSAVKRLRQGDGSLANTSRTLIDRANARTTEAQRLSAVMLDRQIAETEAARQQAAKAATAISRRPSRAEHKQSSKIGVRVSQRRLRRDRSSCFATFAARSTRDDPAKVSLRPCGDIQRSCGRRSHSTGPHVPRSRGDQAT